MLQSEWDPILTPKLSEYAWLRVNNNRLELKLATYKDIVVTLDSKAIPQLIKILSRLENKLE
jgi:hypothetical protein